MKEQKIYKEQMHISTVKLAIEIPNFMLVTLLALFSHSIIVWIDFVESLGNLIATGCVVLMSKKMTKDLEYEYNYGIGKIEAITALISESIGAIGFLCFILVSIHELFHAEQPSELLGYVLILKLLDIAIDFVFLWKQYKIKKTYESGVTDGEYIAYLGDTLFDVAAFAALLIVWAVRNHPLSWYLSPLFGLIIAVIFMTGNLKRVKESALELMDITLPEEEQLKILRVLTAYNEEYSEFHAVKSHCIGQKAYIDIYISFPPEKTYAEILNVFSKMKNDLANTISNCKVNFIIE